MNSETINTEKFVKLTNEEKIHLSHGRLKYVLHPEKGVCKANQSEVYIGIIELTEKEKEGLSSTSRTKTP